VERLCDRVGIVRSGRLVACGTVDELTSGAAVEIAVHAPLALPGWATTVPGVTVVSEQDGRTLLRLDNGVDDQAVLAAALATGPVREFGRRRRSLTELFRDVVTEEPAR
jgi:ABC-2 type transport system ATP-binding protein